MVASTFFNSKISSRDLFFSSSHVFDPFWKRHCPTKMKARPGTIRRYPANVYFPGILCTSVRSIINEAKNGYRLITNAGIIGSGNIFVSQKTEKSWPSEIIMAIYMNPEKCWFENKLHIPQNESKSKVHPCTKILEKHIKIQT